MAPRIFGFIFAVLALIVPGVAAAQNYEGINLASEVFREKDVGAPIANGFHRVPS